MATGTGSSRGWVLGHCVVMLTGYPRANFCSPAPNENPFRAYGYGFPPDNLTGLSKIIQFMYILIYNIYIKYLIINKYSTKEQALLL